jgi:hypothetical protein
MHESELQPGPSVDTPLGPDALEPAVSDPPTGQAVIPGRSDAAAVPAAPCAGATSDRQDEAAWSRIGREVLSSVRTLVSAAVYATLIVTFGFQVARVDGMSMAPTLEDHDRLIVDKLVY